MSPSAHSQNPPDLGIDAETGHRLVEVKIGAAGLRSVRMGLFQLAYDLADRPHSEGFLVLSDVAITRRRLEREWQHATSILLPELLNRLSLCLEANGQFSGMPRNPDPETEKILSAAIATERTRSGPRRSRPDASFVVTKILLHQWLASGQPVTADWLRRTSGYAYPTIALVLKNLGSLIERESDRRVRLRWFPHEEFMRLLAVSNRARSTARFADRSGQPRSPESHVRRLEKLDPPRLAIGGVLGARHYFSGFDLVGSPRLDLSMHCPQSPLDLDFIAQLDPALKPIEDPLEPASVVVHAVRHADALFAPREGGLRWADPVECLLDLHDARLDVQAAQFLKALQQARPSPP
jgi:hypothetical protein